MYWLFMSWIINEFLKYLLNILLMESSACANLHVLQVMQNVNVLWSVNILGVKSPFAFLLFFFRWDGGGGGEYGHGTSCLLLWTTVIRTEDRRLMYLSMNLKDLFNVK